MTDRRTGNQITEVSVHLACTWCGGRGWTMDGLCHCTTDRIDALSAEVERLRAQRDAWKAAADELAERLRRCAISAGSDDEYVTIMIDRSCARARALEGKP